MGMRLASVDPVAWLLEMPIVRRLPLAIDMFSAMVLGSILQPVSPDAGCNRTIFPRNLTDSPGRHQHVFAKPPVAGRLPIFPQSETMFFLKVVDAQIEFATDGSSLVLHQNGRSTKASRR